MPGLSWTRPGPALHILVSLVLIVVIPFLLGELAQVTPESTAGLIFATLVIEYSAPVAALAGGLPPLFTGITVILVACGVISVQYTVFDAMCCRSGTIQRFLDWTRRRYAGSPVVHRYGVIALAPLILTVGFYISPAISWLLGWDRKISFVVMISVYSVATAGVLFTGLGIMHWLLG